jgi:hypothetical protein
MSAIIFMGPCSQSIIYLSAGDFVNFGFPMAYTVTARARDVIDYESAYSAAGMHIMVMLNM